ncbi:N-acetylmuramoyl-L-alanine amidase [Streptomyces sp. MI02-2A]|uniref:peptidoglycan recognition protein family protein n=1 Tax=unclassified Streptomyces TaxID=2593676 RepID=UPI0029A59720|nr:MULTISPECIES: N-acetylmuramoyl-L-alanine amidase [unclassified Streptomyces]MDX3260848.1 N-acetylmuramoyl-L-alanine amidase [Streptomyces sp. MI02-2A]
MIALSSPMSPAQWRAALTAEGVRFTEYPGWTERGRDAATGKVFGPVNGVLNHHTAGTNSMAAIAVNGRPGLPPPLAHAHLPKSSVLVLVADGRANHAGLAAKNSFDAVVAEKPIPKPDAKSGTVDGNDVLYGLEVENLGDGVDVYTRAQYDTWVRFNAAICRHHQWGAGSCAGHLETSVEGKVDPRGRVEGYGRRGTFTFTMAQFRADVAERLAHPASWSPSTQEADTDMPQYENLGLVHPYTLAPGAWRDVQFTQEWTDETGDHAPNSEVFVEGPARFTGSLSLRFEDLPVGDVVQVRMSEWEGDELQQVHPIHEVIGTPGGAYGIVPLTKRIGSGRNMRVRLLNQSAAEIEVASAVLTTLVWKES